jgi:hypothetical protein
MQIIAALAVCNLKFFYTVWINFISHKDMDRIQYTLMFLIPACEHVNKRHRGYWNYFKNYFDSGNRNYLQKPYRFF